MNCINHTELPATAYCRTCGTPMCEHCQRTANGIIYCENHVPVQAAPATDAASSPYTAPAPPPQGTQPGASPGLAFLLGLIPGVGAIYNGQYVKGLMHVVILGILIGIVSSDEASGGLEPLFGMMIAAWFAYMAFEAHHTAKRRQLGLPVDEFSSILPRSGASSFPLAPTVLIAFGILFLLNNLDILRFGQLLRYWPVALIALGVYLLYQRLTQHDQASHNGPTGIGEVTHERR